MPFMIIPDPALFVLDQTLPKPVNGEFATIEDAITVANYALKQSPLTTRKIVEVKLYLSADVKVNSATEPPPAPAPAAPSPTLEKPAPVL